MWREESWEEVFFFDYLVRSDECSAGGKEKKRGGEYGSGNTHLDDYYRNGRADKTSDSTQSNATNKWHATATIDDSSDGLCELSRVE